MPSSTSNFKNKLRLPRLFFRRPTQLESVHGGPPLEYERPIPELPWRGLTVVVVLIVIAATCAWEFYCRSIGYGPTLNDNEDFWTTIRRRVEPESVVIIGDSRGLFDLDLDELEKGLGKRPVQLAMGGSCAYPVLDELANDENFHGTIICSVVPGMFFAPPGPFYGNVGKSAEALQHSNARPTRQSISGHGLEEHVAFLKQEELTLDKFLKRLPIPNRPYAQVPPQLPPYFETLDRERRARMIEKCAQSGRNGENRIQQIWLPLFTPPPPPSYIRKKFSWRRWAGG